MKSIFLFCAIGIFALACGDSKPGQEDKTQNVSAEISGVYEGSINDKFPIVLTAETKDGKIEGSYFYRKVGADITISGSVTNADFEISETDAKGKITGTFSGTVFSNGDSLSGKWKNADGSHEYAFYLKRSKDPVASKIRIKTHYFIAIQKKDADYPDEEPYAEGYSYPELSGMENASLQKELNKKFYPQEIDEIRKNTDYASAKEVSMEKYDAFQWPHGHSTTTLSIGYYDSRIITWSSSTEFDGGAHPSFGFSGYTSVFLSNGATVTVNDLLQGGWKSLFLEKIRESNEINEWDSDNDDPCAHIRDTLLVQVGKWTGKEQVYLMEDRLIIIADDNRSFGCPEMARGVFEISADFESLKPFIKPGSALEALLK